MFESIKNFFKNLKPISWFFLVVSFIGLILLIVGWNDQSDTTDKEKISLGQSLKMIGLVFVVIGVFGYLMYSKNQEVKNELI